MTKVFRCAIQGAPGSGKGTLSSRIVEKFDIQHISTGEIFRKHILNDTAMGRSVEKYISKGMLVPDVLVMRLIKETLGEIRHKNWLLDGFPRTRIQAEKLFMNYPLNLVISLNVPLQELIDRVKHRWVHLPSGRIYNTNFKPPKVPGKDDLTGEPLTQRPDDRPEAVEERLKIYSETMGPLMDFYKKQKILREFTGTSTDMIWPEVEKELLKYMKPKS